MQSASAPYIPGINDEEAGIFDRPNETGSPERRLLLAVLERAILDYVGNDAKEVEAAEHWIFGDIEKLGMGEFSFPWVCEALDLDPRGIAEVIHQMPKRGTSRIAPWYFADPAAWRGKHKNKNGPAKVITIQSDRIARKN